MWLSDLSFISGISEQNNDLLKTKEDLIDFGIIKLTDDIAFNEQLKFEFLVNTLANLVDDNIDDELIYDEKINRLLSYGLIKNKLDKESIISQEEAIEILNKTVNIINNQEINKIHNIGYLEDIHEIDALPSNIENYKIGDILFNDNKFYKIVDIENNSYEYEELNFEDIMNEVEIADTFVIDFDKSIIETSNENEETKSVYEDGIYTRKANFINSNRFTINGFNVSYTISQNKIHLHVSKKTDNGINIYYDGDVYNIKPSYRYKYENGIIKDAYFKINFNANNEIGMSVGRYQMLYGDFASLKKDELFNTLKSFLKDKKDGVNESFTICKIKTPIPNVPFLYFDIELKLNIYVSGRAEIVMDGKYTCGLEIRNNKIRTIYDKTQDIDSNIEASAAITNSLIFSLNLLHKDLLNTRINFGAKAKAKGTIHLLQDDGNLKTEFLKQDYDVLKEYEDSEKVLVCGDLSLAWLLNIELNNENSIAYNLGLNKNINILDDNDQIFNNLSHIENGLFVKECTRKEKKTIDVKENYTINSDRISLEYYSLVLKNQTMQIKLKTIPNGYTIDDIKYNVENPEVVSVSDEGLISRKDYGVTKVKIYTKDNKYEIYLNILVSKDA